MGHKKNKKEQQDVESKNTNNGNIEEAVPSKMPEEVRKPKKSKKKCQDLSEPTKNKPEQDYIEEKKEKRKKKDKRLLNIKTECTETTEEYVSPTPQEEIHKQKEIVKNQKIPLNILLEEQKHASSIENNESLVTVMVSNTNNVKLEQEQVPAKVGRPPKSKKNSTGVEEEKVIDWPEKDLTELFRRMETALPEKDTLAYSTRVEKLNWDDIAFKSYTADECKSTWQLVQKRLRRFRLLNELLQDAKEWTTKPWTNFYSGQKTKRHPAMPRRPLSTYMLFYLHQKDKIISENPGLEMTEITKLITQMYKTLSPLRREKYMKEAAEKKRIYEMELEEFYRQHPEVARNVEKSTQHKQVVDLGPKKPNTPFALYYESQLKSLDPDTSIDKHTFKEQIKEQWRSMSDKKKMVWINWASDEEAKYQDELKNYISQNPDFVPVSLKPVLTKEEKIIKERMAGKPMKPPNSAYSLFSRMMLQSDEIKEVNPKDRMTYISEKWKNCTEEERKEYNERILHLREQYKLDFATYLESIPEEKRQEEMRSTQQKRKRTVSKMEEKEKDLKKKKSEPEPPEPKPEPEHVAVESKLKKPIKMEDAKSVKKLLEEKVDNKEEKNKLNPFAEPEYWSRMKKEEKKTYKNAMLKLKEHLDSRFEKYISSRGSDSSDEDSDSEDSNDAASSSS